MNTGEVITHDHFLEYEVEQASDDWWELKKGIPSASNFDKIITPAKGEPSTQWEDYAAELIGDRYSLIPPEGVENFTNRAIRWGEQTEAEARAWYTFQTGLPVRKAGWLTTLDGRFGCSPDGLVGETGGLELKCPQAKQHILYCLKPERLLKQYRCQVHGALWLTKRLWWDLVSYSPLEPGWPMGLRIRVEPDDFTEKLGAALEVFHGRYMEALEQIRQSELAGVP